MKMSKRNYKIYAEIGISKERKLRTCAVLDTGAGPNFDGIIYFPRTDMLIRTVPSPIISDTNGRPITLLGTATLFVLFGTYVVKFDLLVCKQLATDYVLGGDFWDRFMNSIRSRKRVLELDDGTKILIVRKRLKRGEGSVQFPGNLKDSQK